MLRKLGCTEMQGYLFSAPKPGAEVKRLFKTAGEASPWRKYWKGAAGRRKRTAARATPQTDISRRRGIR